MGFARELILLKRFGTSLEADILIALITLPDIIVSLFVGNALPAVFLKRVQSFNNEQKLNFLIKLSFWFFLIFSILIFIAGFYLQKLGFLIFPSQSENVVFLNELGYVIWTIPFLALTSVTRLFLQAKNDFLLIGLENVIYNVCIIAALFFINSELDFRWISFSLIAGSLLRWLTQLFKLWFGSNWTLQQFTRPNSIGFSALDLKFYFIALSTGLLTLCMPYIARSFSSAVDGIGALSTFNYAYKFVELPIGLTLTVIGTILFPKLNHQLASDPEHFKTYVSKSHFILLLSLPLSLYLFVGCYSLARFDFLSRLDLKFDLSVILSLGAIGILALSIRSLNEFYVLILTANNYLDKTLRSSIIATTSSLFAIYFLTQSFGISGTFWGISLYFLILMICNLIFTLQVVDMSSKDFFNWNQTKEKLFPHIFVILTLILISFLPTGRYQVLLGLSVLGSLYLGFTLFQQILAFKKAGR